MAQKGFSKILTIVLVLVVIVGGLGFWIIRSGKVKIICGITDSLYCRVDSDCICVDAETTYNAGCFLGNKDYYERCVDKTGTCMDFCTGWGQPPVKCIKNKCTNNY